MEGSRPVPTEAIRPDEVVRPERRVRPDIGGLPDEETERLVQELRHEERRLKFASDELAAAIERCEQALHVCHETGFEHRLREVTRSLESVQEEVAQAFGRKVGERIAVLNSWRVREGIDLPRER